LTYRAVHGYVLGMNRAPSLSRFVVAIVTGALFAAILAFLRIDPRSLPIAQQLVPVVQQLTAVCSEFYRANPSVGALLIASVIGIPAGFLLSVFWSRPKVS
jgi:hypothetical protein